MPRAHNCRSSLHRTCNGEVYGRRDNQGHMLGSPRLSSVHPSSEIIPIARVGRAGVISLCMRADDPEELFVGFSQGPQHLFWGFTTQTALWSNGCAIAK